MTVVPFRTSHRRREVPPLEEITVCRVHGEALLEGETKILYGYPSTSTYASEAERNLFPRASTYRTGGCVIASNMPETGRTKYCAACRRVERAWKRSNRGIAAPGPEPSLAGPVSWLRDWIELVRTRRFARRMPKEEEPDDLI